MTTDTAISKLVVSFFWPPLIWTNLIKFRWRTRCRVSSQHRYFQWTFPTFRCSLYRDEELDSQSGRGQFVELDSLDTEKALLLTDDDNDDDDDPLWVCWKLKCPFNSVPLLKIQLLFSVFLCNLCWLWAIWIRETKLQMDLQILKSSLFWGLAANICSSITAVIDRRNDIKLDSQEEPRWRWVTNQLAEEIVPASRQPG